VMCPGVSPTSPGQGDKPPAAGLTITDNPKSHPPRAN
jgi:hypothetical protein